MLQFITLAFVLIVQSSGGKQSGWEASEAEEYYSPQEELDFLSASDQEDNDEYDIQPPLNGSSGGVGHVRSPTNIYKPNLATPETSRVGNSLMELPEGRHR